MKSSLAAILMLTATFFSTWTRQATAQGLSDVSFSEAVEAFAGPEDATDSQDLDSHPADCACGCGPTWIATADAVFMQRSRPDSLALMQDAFDPTRNLNADAFGFDFTAGWDVSLERVTARGSIEGRFFSIDGWDAATAAIGGPATLVRINTVVPFFLPGVTSVGATYHSELLSAELNLRRELTDWMSLLAGFRYLELDEHFHAELDAAAIVPTTYDTLTRNRLYGGQLGVDATLWCRDRLTIEGALKAGVFHNSGGQNTVLNTGLVVVTAADTSDRTAFLGELGFTANYCLTDRLTLRAGYDLLWLETVALASDQVPATNFFTSTGISADGGAFYHGAFAGLEFRR